MEFKVGDKVRCIRVDKLSEGELTLNKEYVIICIENNSYTEYFRIKNDSGNILFYFSYRFEKVEAMYEVIKPFSLLDILVKFKDNHNCKEFQNAWEDLLRDFDNIDNSGWSVDASFVVFDQDCVPMTLREYRDKLEDKGLIKKIEKEIFLYPGMKLKNTYTKFTYRIINCTESSSNMTYFNILVEENSSCYYFGKIFSCRTLRELNQLTGEEFEVINED